ncbi:MAG TPA: nitric oxide synthase oxygenase [Actinophytocola sp.]|uniref:nitric oxide synthase oxygenase n=1 Tax=Actinophytocola sp. TaxID=1872138 RepID=UPI002E0145DA|nr:nitric oxide synthase oxygenase [Actinophytocola sp.]
MTALRDDVLPLSTRTGSPVPAIFAEAEKFIRMFHQARPRAGQVEARLAKVRAEVAATGTYRHTPAELAFGARMALRESGWCPADVSWRELLVRDLRDVRDAAAVAAECAHHLRVATGDGRVSPMVSVFAPDTPWRPGPRIRNDQLVRYAGYREPEEAGGWGRAPRHGRLQGGGGGVESVLGDRRYVDFTIGVCRLGWRPPNGRGMFDVLPLVVETPDDGITLHPLPRDAVLEVPLAHPELPWFAGLGLRWHAVPVISNWRLSIGGIHYPAAPFNGVYICRAIGEDVLADENAYGLARMIATQLGLDTSSERTLWFDRAVVELNRAVLHSFDAAAVRVEHAAEDYVPAAEDASRPVFRS